MSAHRIAGVGLALLVGAYLLGCGDDGPTEPAPPTVASVEVTPAQETLTALGAASQFSAVAKDADGNTIAGQTFTWTCAESAVATIDANGLATAVGNGTATITATAGGVSGSASLIVSQAPRRPASRRSVRRGW